LWAQGFDPTPNNTEDFPMAGNWMDDRERRIRERDARGLSDDGDDYRSRYDEDRSFGRDERPGMYGPRAQGRDRVFGERESGASYGGPSVRAGRPGLSSGGSGAHGWQSPDYEGVSPAMRQGAYGQGMRFSNQDYTRGGRFYGDDSREPIYREEYGQGGFDDTDAPRGYDAQRSATRERYHAQGYGQPGYGGYPGEYRQPMTRPAAGGTGGYDDGPGYGDGGGRESRGERFEDAGRSAGAFLHRAGEKVASWFARGGEGRIYDPDYFDPNYGKRGLGPQGYKRSDERISDDAHERLTDDTWLDASNIAISVSACEVTLSGTVDSREAKHRAERLVEDISGVTHVQNNLRIAKGSFLTSPTSGYGDSVLGAQMRAADESDGASPTGKKN
jgi:osmotically-inducible protein OsmY